MRSSNNYNAADLEVLRGLEPVKRRPGMYTDTTRPNHLGQEVIDNAVDEAIAGFADRIDVALFKDGSLQVIDNGRGMPVDTHPEEKVSGVEVIMTRLHAGAKFGTKNYRFSGGLHGVGVSVVNALSAKLEVEIRRNGLVYRMAFKGGKPSSELKTVGKAPRNGTGTTVRFWPDERYFETMKFSATRLRHTLRAKAVLCPGLTVTFVDEASGETDTWRYEDGLKDYLAESLQAFARIPEEPFVGNLDGENESVSWAVIWLPEGGDGIAESYANLIPTPQGGTHVLGFRSGLLAALRDMGEFRGFIPKGVKLTPEDVWERCSYVLSTKLSDLQFSGQTKERLSSRECTAFIASVVQDAFAHWLNQNPETAQKLCEMAVENARRRLKEAAKVVRRRVGAGPALPGKLTDCISQDLGGIRALPGGGRLGRGVGQTGARQEHPGRASAAGQDPQRLGGGVRVDPAVPRDPRHRRRDRGRPGLERPLRPALRQEYHPGRCRLGRTAHRDPAVRPVSCGTSGRSSRPARSMSPCRPSTASTRATRSTMPSTSRRRTRPSSG